MKCFLNILFQKKKELFELNYLAKIRIQPFFRDFKSHSFKHNQHVLHFFSSLVAIIWEMNPQPHFKIQNGSK